ncbi:DUF1549 domain-containing protein [Roseimaritima ulvae]|nr:DUF1549 domain-containing protein [Roseimaritima ulvae]
MLMRFDVPCRDPRCHRWLPLAMALLVASMPAAADDVNDRPLSFVNDIVPVLTKSGCNTGVCHAKAGGGQNGFQLSLLGFEPAQDYDAIVRGGRGRRLSPAAVEQSLLLRKAAGQLAHGGGVRIPADSVAYTTLRQWIAQGAPFQQDAEPTLTSIAVEPSRGVLAAGQKQPLQAVAHYSDGSVRDVTRLALYESNDPAMLEVDQQGLASALDVPGKAAVMVRYQGQVAVYSAAIPLGADAEEVPAANNFIDELVFANLRDLGIPPSPGCDDATFLRRVTLDIAGRLPTADETDAFLATSGEDRRQQAIEELLKSPDYADYFANKWTTLLKNRRDDGSDITSNFAFHAWVRDSLLANRPYDQIVRELLAATGTVMGNPAVAWYKRVKDPKQQIEDVAQLFLGVRMQCAQCHHHPFERWSQDDYYGLVAFFSRVGRKPSGVRGEDLIFHQRGVAGAKNPQSGETIAPRVLSGLGSAGGSVGPIPPGQDPRLQLADWLQTKDNPFFAKAVVNRYWKHFFRRGLIEPEDDIRDTNPPTNPELLAALETHFINSGFDLKELVRVITNSAAYQLSSTPNEHNVVDRQNYSRFYPKRLQAEVLLDAIDDLTDSQTSFANLPIGTRAVALPDNSYNRSSPFLKVFGRPENESVCECERVQSASLAQSLHLLNAADIKSKLASAGGRADRLAKAADLPLEQHIDELYQVAFSRSPTSEERATATEYLSQPRLNAAGKPIDATQAKRENLQDLLWALMNTKEFLFNH